MASTQTFSEGNGASAGTETTNATNMNWKNLDSYDNGGANLYSSNPVVANTNSFTKYQAIVFAGTFNSLSSLTVAVDNNSPATGVTIHGAVVSTAATPSITTSGDGLMPTTATAVNFTGQTWATAFAAGTASAPNTSTPRYTQPLRTQLQTTSAAAPGDITSRTFTWSWTES